MSDPEDRFGENSSDGGGLRRQLEDALQRNKELEQSLPAQVKEAEDRGRAQAQRRFDALEAFGKDRPGLAEAWVNQHPEDDLTADRAKEFAASFGVELGQAAAPPPATPQVPPEVQQGAQDFQQQVAAQPNGGTMTRAEYEKKLLGSADERREAQQAAKDGRIELNNPGAADVVVKDPAGFFAPG